MSRDMPRTVTAQHVAERAGVSRAAVSRTFSRNGSVSERTRQKVLQAAEELGYQVNILAQSLNRQRSMLIGLVVTRLSDPFRSMLLEQLLKEIQQAGFQAMVAEVDSADDLEPTLRRFTQFRVSGVIVTSGQPPTQLVDECVRLRIPVVAINRLSDCVDTVCSDNQQGAVLAANQLLDAGCTRLGWLNVRNSTWSGIAREQGYAAALAERGMDFLRLETDSACYEGGRRAAQALLAEDDRLEGLFCANALLACGFLDGMREAGLDAPRDFRLVGFDDIPQTGYVSYQLTTLKQDVVALARQALECLQQRTLEPDQPCQQRVVPVELVSRRTTSGN